MVVDAELEAAKSAVIQLMKDKEAIEARLTSLNAVLESNRVGMSESLIDSDGYPRNDIDVYRVRHARHEIICLKNDHKEIMRKIEDGLIKIHGCAPRQDVVEPAATFQDKEHPDSAPLFGEPFLRVDMVSPGSPAELAGIRVNDQIMEFGSVNYRNFKSLEDIASLVEHSRYKPITVGVKRNTDELSLILIPRPWSGKGLLGCNVIPLEMVER